jgi:8-oxo-dGTP pyrophosphatase MutT (NUDIX family)
MAPSSCSIVRRGFITATPGAFPAVLVILTKLIIEGAIREAVEETGINPADLQPVHTFTDDHDGWSYSTVIALANEHLEGHETQ